MFCFSHKGHRIPCRVSGGGPPVVLLHGFGGHPSDWRDVERLLKRDHQVIIPHLSHLTLGPQERLFSTQVEILSDLLEMLYRQYGAVDLVGVSYGGALSWALRSVSSRWLKRVILINPMPPDPVGKLASGPLRKLLAFARFRWLLSLYLWSSFGKRNLTVLATGLRPDYAERFRRFQLILSRKQKVLARLVSRFSHILTHENWGRWHRVLRTSQVPLLMVYSKRDQLFSSQLFAELADELKADKVVVLEFAQHMAVRTHPHEVFAALEAFQPESDEGGELPPADETVA